MDIQKKAGPKTKAVEEILKLAEELVAKGEAQSVAQAVGQIIQERPLLYLKVLQDQKV